VPLKISKVCITEELDERELEVLYFPCDERSESSYRRLGRRIESR